MANITPQDAARELLLRERMRSSLVGFAQNIDIPGVVGDEDESNENDPGKIWQRNVGLPEGTGLAAHHLLLMRKLQETMQTRYGRLMVFMPPGSAKSTYSTVVAPVWFLGNNPGRRIILGSYNLDLAKKQGNKARKICEQENYISAFGTTLDRTTNAKELWSLENGSEYMSAGLSGGLTGNRADGIVIDDPIRGRADAESETVRNKTWGEWVDDAQTRLLPGGWVIWIQTRWHFDDPAGRILPPDWDGESGVIEGVDGLPWTVLCLKAKIEDEKDEKFDPLGRKIGEYIWPEWFDARHWRMYEPRPGDPNSPSPYSWASLFQQTPKPKEGNQFEEEWVNWYTPGKHPKYLMKFAASDYALTEETEDGDPDYTEHGIAGLDEQGDLWLVDWWYGRGTPDVTIDAFVKLCKKHNVRNAFGEKGLIEKALAPQLSMRMRQLAYYVKVKYLPIIQDKSGRFFSFRGMAADGRVHIPDNPWGRRLVQQLCDFPQVRRGYHDDGVDVCSLFGRGLEGMKWSTAMVTREPNRGVKFGSWEWLTMDTEKDDDIWGDYGQAG